MGKSCLRGSREPHPPPPPALNSEVISWHRRILRMGMFALNRLMSLQRDRQRRRLQIRARCGLNTSRGRRKGSPCQQGGDGKSQAAKIMRSSIPDLPEEILFLIHCLMPMRDAARAACASRAFLHSWRFHPNLIFNEDTIGLKINGRGENFHHKVGRILRKHSGIGVKTFNLDYSNMCGFDGSRYFDSWLQIALKPGIEKLTLWLPTTKRIYNFPCSLLSDGVRNSLQYLQLHNVALHPTVELGSLRSLTSLHLNDVRITWDELECLLCNSLALEQLVLECCEEIICLKIPCSLQRFSSLRVIGCYRLRVIESKAPNLSSLNLAGHRLNFSHVETLQVKKLAMDRSNFIGDARGKLPSSMPKLETLVIISQSEVVDAPTLPTKFLYLKHLTIKLLLTHVSRPYDCYSLVSFLDASPSLETLVLAVSQRHMLYQSVFEDSQLRQIPARHHGCLRSVKICGFSSAKCLVELASYILNNAVSLECLTLDTMFGYRCGEGKQKNCHILEAALFKEAHRALLAVRTYIENKVPSTDKLTVREPCRQCHASAMFMS